MISNATEKKIGSPDWERRYLRQIEMPEIGRKGQALLGSSSILVVGAGGLGSPAAYYLAAAGVGCLGLVDQDRVEVSNLQRQTLHGLPDIGKLKVESAAEKLTELNPFVRIETVAEKLVAENAQRILYGYDFVIDATDNFAAKFLIADTCHALGRPYSHAGIRGFVGQTITVIPGRTCCYRCLFNEPPVEEGAPPQGPLGVVPGVIGTIQATEAIKCVLGIGHLLTDRLFVFDALAMTFRLVAVKRNAECPLCGHPPDARGGIQPGADERSVKP